MKKLSIFLLSVCFGAGVATAQPGAITNAILYHESGELDNAKTYIDKAAVNEKSETLAKTWYNRGLIYESILNSQKPEYKMLSDSAGVVAYNSYNKAVKLDKPNGQYAKLATEKLSNLWNIYINDGVGKYQSKDYKGALASYIIAQGIKPADTTAYLYGAYAAEEAGDKKAAEAQFLKLKSIGYKGRSLYQYLSDAYIKNGNDSEALATLNEGRQLYPNDKVLMITEMNYYLKKGQMDVARQKIEEAITRDPKNSLLYFNLGVLYDQSGQGPKAMEAYRQSIALNSNNFDAYYNLGAGYYAAAGELIKKRNFMSPAEYNKNGKAIDEQIRVNLNECLADMEKALTLSPNDESVKKVINDVNKRLANTK